MGKALGIFVRIVIPLLLITVAAGFAVLHTQGDQLLSVQTGSMEPAISTGDLLVVKTVPNHQLQVDDVITFNSTQQSYAGATITHRIVELPSDTNDQHFITKGDANPLDDEPVPQNQIVGRVERDVPFVGYLLSFLSTPAGLLALIYIPALFIVIDEIRRLAKHFEAQKPWRDLSHSRFRSSGLQVIASMFIMGSAIGSTTTFAGFQGNVILGPNTISAIQDEEDPSGCEDDENNIDVDIDGGGGGNNNINIDIDTDQDATSGDATNSGNTNGGAATSGDATNCSSVDINIDINN